MIFTKIGEKYLEDWGYVWTLAKKNIDFTT
jgi:hypothetical protein